MSAHRSYRLYFDGGSHGNPGKGYGSYELVNQEGDTRFGRDDYGDDMTNNQAEFTALIHGLRALLTLLDGFSRIAHVTAIGDSRLVVQAITGECALHSEKLIPLRDEALRLLVQFRDWDAAWHPRDESVRRLGH